MQDRNLEIIATSIKTNDIGERTYVIVGIEVEGDNWRDASMFEAIVYPEGGFTTSSRRGWYYELEKLVERHIEMDEFYNNNFKSKNINSPDNVVGTFKLSDYDQE